MNTHQATGVADAAAVISTLLPNPDERLALMQQLLFSIETAQAVSESVWAVTLFKNRTGFRLNVGQLEVFVLTNNTVRLNLLGAKSTIPIHSDLIVEADYVPMPHPHCAFLGTVNQFCRSAESICHQHAEFIRLAAMAPAGQTRNGTTFQRFHSAGLVEYARQVASPNFVQSIVPQKHFVAYHSAEKMGGDYIAEDGPAYFFSSKPLSVLTRAVGGIVWIINGARRGNQTIYTLRGFYSPEQIIDSEDPEFSYELYADDGRALPVPYALNDLPWFPDFLKSQGNFSLGINEIKDPSVCEQLCSIANAAGAPTSSLEGDFNALVDLDALEGVFVEGQEFYELHLRRERSCSLIDAKKAQTLQKHGRLACEVCSFDFAAAYGALGENFCEVHHKTPLASLAGERVTKLSDVAIICSNCHRMIHRQTPLKTIAELQLLMQQKSPERAAD